MKFIIKSCTTNPGGGIPDWWCKIPFWRCSQLQVQEIVFMADRNLEARRRRHLSICQMMAMGATLYFIVYIIVLCRRCDG